MKKLSQLKKSDILFLRRTIKIITSLGILTILSLLILVNSSLDFYMEVLSKNINFFKINFKVILYLLKILIYIIDLSLIIFWFYVFKWIKILFK